MIKAHELEVENTYMAGDFPALSYKMPVFVGLFVKWGGCALLKTDKKVFLNFLFLEK